VQVPGNTGAGFEVLAGQTFTIRGTNIVDLVAFDLHDFSHRFDQARTKANQNTIYVSTGNYLISQRNREMLQIVEDEFEGHHDLQYGMCNPDRWRWALEQGIASRTYSWDWDVTADDFPDHGCFENVMQGLEGYPIRARDVPAPFNIFQHMDLDAETGALRHTRVRPKHPARVSLLAVIDCLISISVCPDLMISKTGPGPTQWGRPVDVIIADAAE
jgi:uncharacterized protein YcgI (DUF1989 family)